MILSERLVVCILLFSLWIITEVQHICGYCALCIFYYEETASCSNANISVLCNYTVFPLAVRLKSADTVWQLQHMQFSGNDDQSRVALLKMLHSCEYAHVI